MLDLLRNDATEMMLRLDQIELNGGTQMRAALNEATLASYVDDMTEFGGWGKFPPVDVFYDGQQYWLGDGFHRTNAYFRYVRDVANILDLRQVPPVPSIVHSGTRRDAVLFAAGRNSSHGLRRNNEDKRRAVSTLLNDDEWRQWSNREIARRCNVGEALVRKMRDELTAHGTQLKTTERKYIDRHGNQQTMETAKIGSAPPKPTPPATNGHKRADDATADAWERPAGRFVAPNPPASEAPEISPTELVRLIARLGYAVRDIEIARGLTGNREAGDRAVVCVNRLIAELETLRG